MLNAIVSSALGFAFWLVAARLFSAAVVGRAGALVSAMALFALIGNLNLSGALMRFLPIAAERRSNLVVKTYSIAISISVLIAAITMWAIDTFVQTNSLRLPPIDGLIFCVAVAFWVVFILEDNVLIGLKRTTWITPENALFGGAKLLLLYVFAHGAGRDALDIFLACVLPLLVICPVVNWLIFSNAIPAARLTDPPETKPDFSNFRRFVIGDAAGGILFQGWTNLLPVIVAITLGGAANALFYISFLISTTIDLLAATMTAALVVEASSSPSRTYEYTLSSVKKLSTLLFAMVVVGYFVSPFLLHLYGGKYAEATPLLRILILSCVPKAAISLFLGTCRIEGRTHMAPVVWGAVCVSVLASSVWLGSRFGVTGVGVAVLLSTGWVGILCALGVARFLDRSRNFRHRTKSKGIRV